MALYKVQAPDGSVIQLEGPDNATDEQITQAAAAAYKGPVAAAEPPEGVESSMIQGAGNLLAGAVRGAGSIGATLMAPVDAAARGMGIQNDFIGRTDRREAMDSSLQGMGAQPNSLLYQGGKIGTEIAGTLGVGGLLAKPVQMLGASRIASGVEPLVSGVANSLRSGGFRVGELAGTGSGAVARATGGAATGAGSAGLVDPNTAGTGALIGGALPGAVQVAGRAGNAIRGAVTPSVSQEVGDLARRAGELGIDIPADRITDSKPLNAVAASLNYVPFSGRQATEQRMTDQLDRALTRTFGQDSSNVTQALRKADTALGGEFERVLSQNGVNVDQQLFEGVTDVLNRAEAELGSDALKPIQAKVNEIITKGAEGRIDGQAAYNIKKDLDRIGRGSGNEAYHARELKGVLMDALDRSLGTAEAEAFAQTRRQYGNMLALEKLAKNGAEGGVSAARLANMKNINNPELQELADIAAQFVRGREGQHGAAQRAVIGGVAGYATGLSGLAAGATAGRLANSALSSNSLRNAVLNQGGQRAVQQGDVTLLNQLFRQGTVIPLSGLAAQP